ncbi:peptidoglycan/LPS O-acetylase OafA/YrhL [Streptacidiphilus sp. MAP12-33]|uniref:acyltransferase family protein n=1 Tax=Streptacidiphilus sp. MAP12-33 TaxID=3156266 RepID=UPI0035147B97
MRTTSLRRLAARIDAATPPERDRAIDALRAFAILGVVLGHWLVTALVVDSGSIHVVSPLQHLPAFTPVSWAFQTLAVFFLVGGQVATKSYDSAKARGDGYLTWLWARLFRLFRPVLAVLAVWTVTASALLLAGVSFGTVESLVKLVLSPMWFLLVFAALTAATPLVRKVHPLWPLAVVLHVDLIRFAFHAGPSWLGWLNLPAGWLVPYCLGALWAREGLRGRTTGWVLLVGGVAATALLITQAGYPASMVGVPGAKISNLNPPTLAAATFGLAQCGLALLLLGPLRRTLRRPAAWAAVALVNLSAMTIFLWHQTSMIAVTALGLLAGHPLLGLHTTPDTTSWILARLCWLPVFATMLTLCWATFRHHEQGGGRRRQRTIRVAGSPGSERLQPVASTVS